MVEATGVGTSEDAVTVIAEDVEPPLSLLPLHLSFLEDSFTRNWNTRFVPAEKPRIV